MPNDDDHGGRQLVWTETLPHPSWPEAEPDAVVWIDTAKFDVAWERSDQWISPGGRVGAQDQRYPRVGEWVGAGKSIEMCFADRDQNAVRFTNGRHRFAWLRDHGVRAMPMQVSPNEAGWFEELLGTPLRVSVLPEC